MPRIISVLNYKGGTGKTTTVVNLGAGLALSGARVLCLDMDPQGSLGTWLGVRHTCGVADVMLGYVAPEACIVPARENLDLILGSQALVHVEGQLWKFPDERAARRVLHHTMKNVNSYDYILLDCSHSISMLTHNALLYANELIIPVSTDYLAMLGVRQVIDTLKNIGRIPDHNLKLTLVVPTMYYERLRKDREVLQLLEHYFRGKVAAPIRANVKLAEAASRQQSIYEYAPDSYGALDYARLVERVLHNG